MVFSLSIPLASIIFRTSSLKSDSGDSVISTFALSCSSICFTHLWFIIWFIVYLLDTSRTNMCRMRCSQSTGENSLDQYKAAFTLGAQVRYSLSTNVNPLPPLFFQVTTLEFGHGACAWGLVLGHKSEHLVPVRTPFLLVPGQPLFGTRY